MTAHWTTKPLGDICDILDSKRKPVTKSDRKPGPFPYYGATGILDYVADYIFDEKLVLIGEDGAKWAAGENTAFIADGQYWVNNHAHVIRPRRSIVLDEWIIYYINANDQAPFITGLTVPKLNQAKLCEIPVPLPPLAEQKRIVAILDDAFAGIAAATANAEKNLANARELFDGCLEEAFSETKAGRKPVPLTQLTTNITDGDHMPPPKSPSGVPFITISNIHKGTNTIDFSDTFKVPRAYFDDLKPNKRPQLGDVLYTVTGSFGIPVIVQDSTEFCFQRHIGLVRPKRGVDSKWLYYALLSPPAFKQAADGATGTAQKTVSLKVLRSLQLPDIPLAEQVGMTSRLDALYARTKSLESVYTEKLARILELKQTLLQKVFSSEPTALPEKAMQEEAA